MRAVYDENEVVKAFCDYTGRGKKSKPQLLDRRGKGRRHCDGGTKGRRGGEAGRRRREAGQHYLRIIVGFAQVKLKLKRLLQYLVVEKENKENIALLTYKLYHKH